MADRRRRAVARPRWWRQRVAGAGALFLGTALLAAAGLIAVAALRGSSAGIEAEATVLVTADGGGRAAIEAHSTPSIAVDPADSRHLVLAERIDRPGFGCRLHVSSDGGSTWFPAAVALPAGRTTCYIPDVSFSGGAVLLVYLTLNTHPKDPLSAGNDPNGMYVARSEDGGRTFAPPLALPGSDNLQPRIVVDPRSARVDVVYVQGSPLQNETPLGLGPPPNPIMVVSSKDGGHTFGAPVQVSDPARLRVAAPTPVVAADGTLLVLYEDYENDLDDYNNRATPYGGHRTLVLARSRDGVRFAQTVVDADVVRPHRELIYLPQFPSLAVAPDGRHVYVSWSDARDGAPDLLLRRSADGGTTWSSAAKINHRPDSAANFELPVVSAPTNDRVIVLYEAFTGSRPDGAAAVVSSSDGGGHFGAATSLSPTFDASVGVPSLRNPGTVDFGSRLALGRLGDGSVIAAWSDSSRGTRDTGRQDVFTARLTLT